MIFDRDNVILKPSLLPAALASGVLTSANSGAFTATKKVVIGGTTYTFRSALTGAFASTTVTNNGTDNMVNGETITVNGRVYTFVDALDPTTVDQILIGASPDATLLSFAKAINATGASGVDTNNTTQPNADVSASASVTAHAITLTALTKGVAGNAITLTTDSVTLSLGHATLQNGVNPIANEILIGADGDAGLTNLKKAINLESGQGTNYSIGTVLNPDVSCGAVTSHTVTVTAKSAGHAQNLLATTTDESKLSWGATTLIGGVGGSLDGATLSSAGTYYGEGLEVGQFSEIMGLLNQTVHSGTNPTLDVSFQYSADKVNWMASGDAFAQITTGDIEILKKLTAGFGKYIRTKVVIGGTTPLFTFSLRLAAKQ